VTKAGCFLCPCLAARHRAGSLRGACKVQRSGVSHLQTMKPMGLRLERGRRGSPEGQSSVSAGVEACRNRFQTRVPGTPFCPIFRGQISQQARPSYAGYRASESIYGNGEKRMELFPVVYAGLVRIRPSGQFFIDLGGGWVNMDIIAFTAVTRAV